MKWRILYLAPYIYTHYRRRRRFHIRVTDFNYRLESLICEKDFGGYRRGRAGAADGYY